MDTGRASEEAIAPSSRQGTQQTHGDGLRWCRPLLGECGGSKGWTSLGRACARRSTSIRMCLPDVDARVPIMFLVANAELCRLTSRSSLWDRSRWLGWFVAGLELLSHWSIVNVCRGTGAGIWCWQVLPQGGVAAFDAKWRRPLRLRANHCRDEGSKTCAHILKLLWP